MLSAIIIAADVRVPVLVGPDAVVRTLSALVPAAIEGLIRDVVLAAPSGNADLRKIADHAGCELAEADHPRDAIAAGLKRARGESLLVLRAGHAPDRAFLEELSDLSGELGRRRAIFIRAMPETFLTRLLPTLARPVRLLAQRAALPSSATDLEALIRAAKPRSAMRATLRQVG